MAKHNYVEFSKHSIVIHAFRKIFTERLLYARLHAYVGVVSQILIKF